MENVDIFWPVGIHTLPLLGIFLTFGDFVVMRYIFPVLVYCIETILATL
jgi:hypothetical protein